MSCNQVWGIIIHAKNNQSFQYLKPKIQQLFGDDVAFIEKDLGFYKHTYEIQSWSWFDDVKQFFQENAVHMKPESFADVWYCMESDDIVRAEDFQEA